MAAACRILVPTRDSARFVGAFAAHYRRAGLDPLYVLDARSRDDTAAILRAHGFAPLIYEGGGAEIVEGGIMEFGARACETPWVLRMDDDEFPSAELVAFAAGLAPDEAADAYFVSTREVFARGGRVYYSRQRYRYWCHAYGAALSPHLRLFKLERTRFVAKLHSPGMEIDGRIAFAPQAAFHAHFSSVLRTFGERLEKVRGYDRINPGMGWFYGDEYLPELLSLSAHRAKRDGLAQFAPLIATLPPLAPSSAPALADAEAARFSEALARKWRLYYEERGGDGAVSAAGSPVGAYGHAPPPTLVVAPRRLLTLAPAFGEFDFVARADLGDWLGVAMRGEHELVFVWGDVVETEGSDLLRAVARRAMARAAELSKGVNGGLVRLDRAAHPALKLLAATLSFLPARAARPALARAFAGAAR